MSTMFSVSSMPGLMNILSLILGIIAFALPIIALVRKSADPFFSHISYSACILALYCQIRSYHIRTLASDWTALLDTSGFTLKACHILLLVAILLNLINYQRNQKNK